MSERPFWERTDVVDRFAAREPDLRLRRLLDDWRDPATLRVLDLGCAAGRNAVWAAKRGCRVTAIDASPVMLRRTRERLAASLGDTGTWEVRLGRMDDLGWADAESFDLIVALGIYHNARDRAEWDRALSESARVLAPGGRLLVASFTPETDLTGEGMRPVPGEPDVFDGGPSGRLMLFSPEALDREMARHGLHSARPTERVVKKTDSGRRVTSNGLYQRALDGHIESGIRNR